MLRCFEQAVGAEGIYGVRWQGWGDSVCCRFVNGGGKVGNLCPALVFRTQIGLHEFRQDGWLQYRGWCQGLRIETPSHGSLFARTGYVERGCGSVSTVFVDTGGRD